MKKRIGLLICAITLPLLSACGNNSKSTNLLTCTYKEFNGAFVSDTIIKYNFDGTEVVGADLKAVIDLSGRSVKDVQCDAETIEECVKVLKEQMNHNCSETAAIENCKITGQSEYGFTFTANVKSESLELYFAKSHIDLKTPKEEMIELLTAKNYECR